MTSFPTVPNGWMLDSVIDYSDMPVRVAGRLVDGMAILAYFLTIFRLVGRPSLIAFVPALASSAA